MARRAQLPRRELRHIDRVTVSARRNRLRISISRHVHAILVEDESGCPRFDCGKSVEIGLHLAADFFPVGHGHQCKLSAFAGAPDLSKVAILPEPDTPLVP